MKKGLAIMSGTLALVLAVAPAAFAVQGAAQPVTADIEMTNAAPSVQQAGSVVIENETTLPDGTKVETGATVDGVASSELEVYVTGSTDVTSDAAAAVGEAQKKANAALAVAQTTGNTVASMIETNPALEEDGLSTGNTVVSTEFYLGIQDKKDGTPYTGVATSVLKMASADEASKVVKALYYDAAAKKWVSVPFTCVGNRIVLITRLTGVYRFVSSTK